MSNSRRESSSSLPDDSEDLDDIPLQAPLSMGHNGRYGQEEPPTTSRGPAIGFARVVPGFQLKLPGPEERSCPGEALEGMRSEPMNLPETSRNRPLLGLGLPLGQLRAASASLAVASEADAPPPTTRRGPHKPPMLSLASPASASPVPSSTPTSAAFQPRPEPAADPPSVPVRVDLVSSAFLLENMHDSPGEASTSDRITEHCSRSLGIAASDLEFYQLRRLEDGIIPDGSTHVGVLIRGSTFSLQALEGMLVQRKQDEQLTTILDRALQESAQHARTSAKQGEELAALREKLRCTEATIQQLREKLKTSDEQRHTLMGTVQALTKEFGALKNLVHFEGHADQRPLQQLGLGGGPAGAADPQVSGSGAPKNLVQLGGGADQLPLQQLSLGAGPARTADPQVSGSGAGSRDTSGRR